MAASTQASVFELHRGASALEVASSVRAECRSEVVDFLYRLLNDPNASARGNHRIG